MKFNDTYSFSDVLSNKSKKLKKKNDERPYFENTNEILGSLYKNPSLQTKEEEDDEEEEKEMKAGSGMSRLKQIYGGAKPTDPSLYSKAKQIADKTYSKPSAYKSGFIQKKYKEMGGEYKDDGKKPLKRWFDEKWKDIGNKKYPVYRPTKRVTKDTPLTVSEIDPKQAREQIKLKQQIKDTANLPPFANKRLTSKGGNITITTAKNIKKSDPLYQVSNPTEVQKKAFEIYGKDAIIYKSDKANKKYQILNKLTGKMVHFGDTNYQDFQKHRDENRRRLYLGRATNMKGKWRDNSYSPNLLSISLLWNGENELV